MVCECILACFDRGGACGLEGDWGDWLGLVDCIDSGVVLGIGDSGGVCILLFS